MAPRARSAPSDAAARVRHLIALDAANVLRRLGERQAEMVRLFSRLRERGPLLEPLHSWFDTVAFAELSALSPHEQRAVNAFYAQLGELRWYLRYTEEMPGQVQLALAQRARALAEGHHALTAAIGPPDGVGAPVVEARVVGRGTSGRRRRG